MTTRSAEPVVQRRVVVGAALAVLALLAVLGVALVRGRSAEDASASAQGEATVFALPQFGGGTFDLQERAGGPVFVYFWASWCAPCAAEAPVIQRLYPEYQAKGYEFVGVNIWDSEKDALRFIDTYGLTFPLVSDPGGKTYMAYGVQQLPAAFFLKPGLELDRKYIGALSEEQLRELLDRVGAG